MNDFLKYMMGGQDDGMLPLMLGAQMLQAAGPMRPGTGFAPRLGMALSGSMNDWNALMDQRMKRRIQGKQLEMEDQKLKMAEKQFQMAQRKQKLQESYQEALANAIAGKAFEDKYGTEAIPGEQMPEEFGGMAQAAIAAAMAGDDKTALALAPGMLPTQRPKTYTQGPYTVFYNENTGQFQVRGGEARGNDLASRLAAQYSGQKPVDAETGQPVEEGGGLWDWMKGILGGGGDTGTEAPVSETSPSSQSAVRLLDQSKMNLGNMTPEQAKVTADALRAHMSHYYLINRGQEAEDLLSQLASMSGG